MYSCDIITDIRTPINKAFSFCITLNIPYINPDDHHVRFRGRDGIVEETPVHVYYAYLKPT